MNDREVKIKALLNLLEFSFLFSRQTKEEIKNKINDFSDADIINLGTILAYEHKNRDSLDKSMATTFLDSLKKS